MRAEDDAADPTPTGISLTYGWKGSCLRAPEPDHPIRTAEANMALFPITDFPDHAYGLVPVSIPDSIVSGVTADPDQLRLLGPAWDAIEQAFPSPMQRSDWSLACISGCSTTAARPRC